VFDFVNLVRVEYQLRLARHGIPLKAAGRTPAQQTVAALEFWAVHFQAAFAVDTLSQAAVEDR